MDRTYISRWMVSDVTISRLWLLFVAVAVFLCFQLIDDGLSTLRGGDDAIYLLLAKALATGQGYADIHMPGHPSHTEYPPPLFPLLLAPVYYLFGYNFLFMRLLVIGFALASFFTVRRLVTRVEGVGELPGLLVAFLFITNFGVLVFSAELLPETLYVFLSLAVLAYSERISHRGDVSPYALCLPFLVVLAYLAKGHGLALYGAVLVALFFRLFESRAEWKRTLTKLVLFAVLAIAPLLLAVFKSAKTPDGVFDLKSTVFVSIFAELYGTGAGTILARVWENLGLVFTAVPGSLITFVGLGELLPAPVYSVFSFFILLTVLCGFAYALYQRRSAMEFYVLIYLCMIIFWPVYGLGDVRRYMVPLVPLFYYYSFSGFNVAFNLGLHLKGFGPGPLVERGWFMIPFALFVLLNLAEIGDRFMPRTAVEKVTDSARVLGRASFERVDEVSPDSVLRLEFLSTSPCYFGYLSAAFSLRGAARPADVVMTRKPEVTALITGSYALRFPYTSDDAALEEFMRVNGVDYVLLDACYDETREYLAAFVNRNPELFYVMMNEGRNTGVLKFKGDER